VHSDALAALRSALRIGRNVLTATSVSEFKAVLRHVAAFVRGRLVPVSYCRVESLLCAAFSSGVSPPRVTVNSLAVVSPAGRPTSLECVLAPSPRSPAPPLSRDGRSLLVPAGVYPGVPARASRRRGAHAAAQTVLQGQTASNQKEEQQGTGGQRRRRPASNMRNQCSAPVQPPLTAFSLLCSFSLRQTAVLFADISGYTALCGQWHSLVEDEQM
jgi:hypothetical protein